MYRKLTALLVGVSSPTPAWAWSRVPPSSFPRPAGQRCMVHFYRNVFSHVPAGN
jgi:transposase-like protein